MKTHPVVITHRVTRPKPYSASTLNDLFYIPPNDEADDDGICGSIYQSIDDRYYETVDLNALLAEDEFRDDFFAMCINARSINNEDHFLKLQSIIDNLSVKPAIIAIDETWRKSNDDGPHCNLDGYFFISNCRKIAKSGVELGFI